MSVECESIHINCIHTEFALNQFELNVNGLNDSGLENSAQSFYRFACKACEARLQGVSVEVSLFFDLAKGY